MATSTVNTSTTGAVASNDFLNSLSNPGASAAASTTDLSDRFLKLLVTQMQNQDPLNPLDNAQVTTQMAQINTVSGIDKLNKSFADLSNTLTTKLGSVMGPSLDKLNATLQTLSGQMLQSQALQGAGLVGHTVLLSGNQLSFSSSKAADGSTQTTGFGAFELAGAADHVTVDVLGPAGQVIDSLSLGAQAQGRSGFSWQPPASADLTGLSFRVTATSGTNKVDVQTLMSDTVNAVSTGSGGLNLELARGGTTPFSLVKAVS